MTRLGPAIFGAAAIGLGILPLVGPGWGYHLEMLTLILFWVGLAGAWNLMCGNTGYIDFGSAAYVGVGSYICGLLGAKAGFGLGASLAAAGAGCAALALAVGYPTLRLRGAYFAIATVALAEALQQVCLEWGSLTEGGLGLTVPFRLSDQGYYYSYLTLAVLVIVANWLIGRSRLGLALRAIRQDEKAARRLGVNAHGAKLWAYCISAWFIGLLGALDATRLGYFTPADVFNVHITIKMVVTTLLGGMGTLLGPVAGAAFLQVVQDLLGAELLTQYLLLIGLAIVVIIIFLPRGILGSRLAKGGRR